MVVKKSTLEKRGSIKTKNKNAKIITKATQVLEKKDNNLDIKKKIIKDKDKEALKLKIKIKAYDYKTVDLVSQKIIDNALRLNAEIKGPIPLPTEIKRVSVNRSTFIHKQSGDQFEMRIHKRLLYIINPKPDLANSLSQISIPRGVEIEISY